MLTQVQELIPSARAWGGGNASGAKPLAGILIPESRIGDAGAATGDVPWAMADEQVSKMLAVTASNR